MQTLFDVILLHFVPSLDEETLRNAEGLLGANAPSYNAFVTAVNSRLQSLAPPQATSAIPPVGKSWRVQVRETVQVIVEPNELEWMDDDDSLGDLEYIQRALTDIDTRFEQQ